MRSCFTKLPRIIAALLTCMLFAILTDCGSSSTPPQPVVVAVSGAGQTTTVATTFGAPFVATVTIGGKPASGVAVVFTSPQGPGCTFAVAPGTPGVPPPYTETDTTDSTGTATSSVCTADDVSGGYNVVAGTLPAAGAGFAMSNTSGPPFAMTASSGTPQSAAVDTAFADPLVANVTDEFGNPVSGASVTFTAPASGVSGTFATSTTNTETDTTDANGDATSSTFTANGNAGGPYKVKATVPGVTGFVPFSLTNTPGGG
jgi:hypothetical protein